MQGIESNKAVTCTKWQSKVVIALRNKVFIRPQISIMAKFKAFLDLHLIELKCRVQIIHSSACIYEYKMGRTSHFSDTVVRQDE